MTSDARDKTIKPFREQYKEGNNLNPLLEEGPEGVIQRVICMMEYLSCMTLQEGMIMDENMAYGRWLIDETMLNALKRVDKEYTALRTLL